MARPAPIPFDTHRFVKRLTDEGMPAGQAEVLADEQISLLNSNLVTRQDISHLATKDDVAKCATKDDVAATNEAVAATNEAVARCATKEEVAVLERRLGSVARDVAVLTRDVAVLKSDVPHAEVGTRRRRLRNADGDGRSVLAGEPDVLDRLTARRDGHPAAVSLQVRENRK